MNKKGASLSINVIVITIIVLVVLVVMILIFGRGVTNFVSGTRDCKSLGGHSCADKLSDCSEYDATLGAKYQYVNIPGSDCERKDVDDKTVGVCCKPIIKIGNLDGVTTSADGLETSPGTPTR